MASDPQRVQSLFLAAVEQNDNSARQAFLAQQCGADAELRRRVEELLAAHDASGSFLDSPLVQGTGPYVPDTEPTQNLGPGTILTGRYKLVEEIGEGGMGAVWMAQQTEPVRRVVAVKVIKAGMDSKSVLARFEAERQALALMDHPNIARVLDAGATPDGRPFFVMELVKGVPITQYCDERKLTPRQRLELFIPVCQAIQHAHQKGVIHRDIKPSNVLVALYDDKPVPKVIDFGVAKAAGHPLTEKTLVTGFGAVVGTPEYMSPEQANLNNLDIDTRSDVYALGVLLYELLTGTPPFSRKELEQAGLLEILRLIREQEPPKPSTRLSSADTPASVPAARGSEQGHLAKLVRGEVDWITMKALEKDRARRYGSATDLAADVERYLRDEPVEACPPSWPYRAGKFLRKHKAALTLAGTAAVLLLLGAVVSGCLAWWALTKEDEAKQAQARAERETSAAKAALEKLRRSQYLTAMGVIQTAWEADNLPRVAELLAEQVPEDGEKDLRNFEWHYWDRQLNQECRKVKIPDSRMEEASALLDGNVALWTNPDKEGNSTFRLVEPVSGRVLFTCPLSSHTTIERCIVRRDNQSCVLLLRPHPGPGLGMEPARVSIGKPIQVWDLQSGMCLSRHGDDSNGPGAVYCLSDDGKRFASTVEKQAAVETNKAETIVKVWELDGPDQQPVFNHRLAGRIASLRLSPDGRLLAIRSSDNGPLAPGPQKVGVWEVATGKLRGENPSGWGFSMAMSFSPDGTRLVAFETAKDPNTDISARPSQVVKWDCTEGAAFKEVSRTELGFVATDLDVSRDGQCLAVYDNMGKKVTILGPRGETRQVIKSLTNLFRTVLSSDGKRLLGVSGGFHGAATNTEVVWHEWEVQTPRAAQPQARTENIVRSRDGARQAAYPLQDFKLGPKVPKAPPHVTVRDRDGKEVCVFRGHTGEIRQVRFSPNGRLIYSYSEGGEHRIWDTETGDLLKSAESDAPPAIFMNQRFVDHASTVVTAWSQEYPLLLWPEGGEWKIMNFDDTSILFSLGKIHGVIVSSEDGRRLITEHQFPRQDDNGDGVEYRLWDVATAKVIQRLSGKHQIAFSSDGRHLVSVRHPGGNAFNPAKQEADVWDSVTGKKRFTLDLGKEIGPPGFLGLAFNAKGTQLLTSGERQTLWSLESGERLCHLESNERHEQNDNWAFSLDGTRLARLWRNKPELFQDGQGKVTVWDAATGHNLLSVTVNQWVGFGTLTFTEDGHSLRLGNRDLVRVLVDATPRVESKR